MQLRVELARLGAARRSACRPCSISSSMSALNAVEGLRADELAAVDEERRGAVGAQRGAGAGVRLDRRAANLCESSAALNLPTSRPISCAYFSSVARSSACWLAKSLSCISQNLPCSCAAIDGLGGGLRVGVERQRLVAEHDAHVLAVGLLDLLERRASTRLQNGHWKSDHSTMVTLASFGPDAGASAGTSTFGTAAGPGRPAALLAAAARRGLDALREDARVDLVRGRARAAPAPRPCPAPRR